MKDRFDREIDYLRISLTDKCNMRCIYCMPPSGIASLPHSEVLTFEEIIRLVNIMARCGIKRVRLTGGEPLLKRDFDCFIKDLASIKEIEEIGITTNGLLLEDRLDILVKNKVRYVNVSLDSLDRKRFMKVTRVDALDKVLRGIDKAIDAGIMLKTNSLILRGINEEDITLIAGLSKDMDVTVRFIELMPIGCGKDYEGLKEAEILEVLTREYGKGVEINSFHGGGPARYVRFEGFKNDVGFINPMSCKFCKDCNRIRLMSNGELKQCLYYNDRTNLKKLIKDGASDDEIYELLCDKIYNKPESHYFEKMSGNVEKSGMSSIGG